MLRPLVLKAVVSTTSAAQYYTPLLLAAGCFSQRSDLAPFVGAKPNWRGPYARAVEGDQLCHEGQAALPLL